MSGTTTTSGMAWKIPGPGGRFADHRRRAMGGSGRRRLRVRPAAAKRICGSAGAHTCVENMRHGMSPKDAALDALKRVARNFDNDEKRLEAIDIQFYVLRKDGEYCGASLWDKSRGCAPGVTQFAVCRDGVPSRLENTVSLLSKK